MKLRRTFLTIIASLPFLVRAELLVDSESLQVAMSYRDLQCDHCAVVAAAIASMKERLCAESIENTLPKVASSAVFKDALNDMSSIPSSDLDMYVLSLQKGANCMSDESWIRDARWHYKKLTNIDIQH